MTIVDPPILLGLQPEGNLFSSLRAGQAALRPDDLLALRVQRVGLSVQAGNPPRLKRSSNNGSALLILHLPPQAVVHTLSRPDQDAQAALFQEQDQLADVVG